MNAAALIPIAALATAATDAMAEEGLPHIHAAPNGEYIDLKLPDRRWLNVPDYGEINHGIVPQFERTATCAHRFWPEISQS